jgi:hypothetical protein
MFGELIIDNILDEFKIFERTFGELIRFNEFIKFGCAMMYLKKYRNE